MWRSSWRTQFFRALAGRNASSIACWNLFLKLVAIATVADMVPLTGENRMSVKFGLAGLSEVRVIPGFVRCWQWRDLKIAYPMPAKLVFALRLRLTRRVAWTARGKRCGCS